MRKYFLKRLLANYLLCVFFLLGCGIIKEEPDPSLNLAKELWGEWLRIDKNEVWYISRDSIKIDSNAYYGTEITGLSLRSVKLKKQSNDVMQVTEGDMIYYLYASRTANASFSGRIASFDDGSRSTARSVAGGKGWAKVVVENLNNGTKTNTTTDAEGEFTVDSIIPGDDYKITPEQGSPVTFTPVANGDDAGTITVVDRNDVNFKISTNISNTSMLTTRGYTSNGTAANGISYSNFEITVQNTGGKDVTAATYELSFDPGLSIVSGSGSLSGILRTIEPGQNRKISFSIQCSSTSISGDYEFKKIHITITDPIANRTWNDSVSLRFFKETTKLVLSGNANGMVILPNIGSVRCSSKNVVVPKLINSDYILVFCGATADTEDDYSLEIANLPYQDSILGIDLARYEPNDTEETATEITGSIHAYLHKNDIDYYRFRFKPEEEKGTTIDSCTVVFNSNGGSNVPIQVITAGGIATRPVNPTRSDYTFVNWYSDSGLTTVYDFSTKITENTTLYAKWNSNSETFQVVSGENLAAKFTWLSTNAVRGGVYVVEATNNNENISAHSLSFPNGSITITLKSSDQTRTIGLSSNGRMFTINSGITFILDENIILQGRSSNSDALVSVNSGGTLIMNEGSRITGNSNISVGNYAYGGGVYIGENGNFTMNGGTISGNTVVGRSDTGYGGGIFIDEGGTFTMSGGVISGNTATAYVAGSIGYGGGVFVYRGTFAKTGGTIYGYTAGDDNKNMVLGRSGGPVNNQGHAVYATGGGNIKRQETNAGPELDLLFIYESGSLTWNGEWDY